MGSCYYPFPAVNKVTMPLSDPTYDCSAFGQVLPGLRYYTHDSPITKRHDLYHTKQVSTSVCHYLTHVSMESYLLNFSTIDRCNAVLGIYESPKHLPLSRVSP
jgi:hypothetical protein